MSTLKNAATGGLVVGAVLSVAVLVIVMILLPAVIAYWWYIGYIGFETAVIALLLITIYLSGGGSDD